jgi:type I restriction enzyme, S subunit
MAVEAPDGWKRKSLGDLVEIKRGISWSNDQEVSEGTVGAYPVLGIPNVQDKLELSDVRFISGIDSKKAQSVLAKKGWALMVGSNGNPKRVGNCVYINETGAYLFASFLLGLHPIDDKVIQSEFMFRILCSDPIQKSISDSVQGSTGLKNISVKMLRDEQVLLPPLSEQKKIAAILESVDDTIAKTEGVIAQTQRVKQGFLQQLLTRGIGHTKFKQTELGEIPESWEVNDAEYFLNQEYLLKLKDGNHGAFYPRSSEFSDLGIPFIAASNIDEFGNIDFSGCPKLPVERAKQLTIGPAKGGDVFLTHNATIGRVAYIPDSIDEVIASTSTTYYRFNKSKIDARFFVQLLRSDLYQKQLRTVMGQSTRNQVPITAQKKLILVLPDIDEQVKISKIATSFDDKLNVAKLHLNNLKSLKSGLMSDLLTGRVRVNVDTKPSNKIEAAA